MLRQIERLESISFHLSTVSIIPPMGFVNTFRFRLWLIQMTNSRLKDSRTCPASYPAVERGRIDFVSPGIALVGVDHELLRRRSLSENEEFLSTLYDPHLVIATAVSEPAYLGPGREPKLFLWRRLHHILLLLGSLFRRYIRGSKSSDSLDIREGLIGHPLIDRSSHHRMRRPSGSSPSLR
jgi:hypothetical protein